MDELELKNDQYSNIEIELENREGKLTEGSNSITFLIASLTVMISLLGFISPHLEHLVDRAVWASIF